MDDLNQAQREKLGHIVSEATFVRALLQHEGMAIVRRAIDNQVDFNRKRWYAATTPEEAEKIRSRTAGFEAFFDLCNAIIKNGEAASKALTPSDASAAE